MSAPRPIMAKGMAASLPLDLVLEIIQSLPRPLLARLAARIVERLDELDGDPDLEDDDPAGQADEDGINTGVPVVIEHGMSLEGPGCPWSDPGEMDCRELLRPIYDGEDQTVVIIPAPAGIAPYRFPAT